MEIGKERWDLLAAGACLLVGLMMGLGAINSAGLLLVLSLLACSYVWYHGTPVSVGYSRAGQGLEDLSNAFYSHLPFS